MIDDTLNDAFGQRQIAQYFTQTNSYFVVLEVSPDLQQDIKTLDKIYLKAANGISCTTARSRSSTCGLARRLWTQTGSLGAPPIEPTRT